MEQCSWALIPKFYENKIQKFYTFIYTIYMLKNIYISSVSTSRFKFSYKLSTGSMCRKFGLMNLHFCLFINNLAWVCVYYLVSILLFVLALFIYYWYTSVPN